MTTDLARGPILEHYASLEGFSAIDECRVKGQFVDLIAVVCEFTEIKATKGTDMHCSLIVCDPTASAFDNAMTIQFYRSNSQDLPRPTKGSVIILRQFKLMDFRGSTMQAWTNRSSTFIIYDANGRSILSRSSPGLPDPSSEISSYVSRLAGWFKTQRGMSVMTEIEVPKNINTVSARTHGRPTLCVKDIRERVFCDLYGYVVKTYQSRDDAYTVYLTDYTSNDELHDYVYGETQWNGPFGKLTIQITLWDAHATFAVKHVREDLFICLRNVNGKRSPAGTLEGAVRGERDNPRKVNVLVIENDHQSVKSIKLRKKQHDIAWRIEKEKRNEEIMLQHQAHNVLKLTPPTSINPYLQTSYSQVPLTAIGDILEPPYFPGAERHEGPGARSRPHKFRTVGRIIDFWPSDLRDFSRPYCMACQSTYLPARNIDDTINVDAGCTQCSAARDDGEDVETYEFSFAVLLEGQDGVCIPVIFSGDDVEVLIGEDIEACNLHQTENKATLLRLREKLFLLWGDLEERFEGRPQKKQKKRRSGPRDQIREADEEESSLMWNEFCVMEYWVNHVGGKAGWQGRRFRGFGMKLV